MGRQALIFALACALAAPASAETDEERAKGLYDQAVTHYDLAEYDQAIDLFKQAYHLSREPLLLFNIAQAYRLRGGNCRNATQFYRNYLRVNPAASNRAAVENWLRELEPCANAEPATQQPAASPPPAPTLPTDEHDAGTPWLRWSLVGGSALSLAGGAAMLAWVKHDYDDAALGCRPMCDEIRDRLQLRAGIGYALLGIGGALAVTAAVVWLREPSSDHAAYVAPTPNGIVVGGRF